MSAQNEYTDEDRKRLFLSVCIPIRLALVGVAYWLCQRASEQNMRLMGLFAFIPAITIVLIWATNSNQIGVFKGVAWWDNLRPVHGAIYAMFARGLYRGDRDAWKWLLGDTALGLTAFAIHNRQSFR